MQFIPELVDQLVENTAKQIGPFASGDIERDELAVRAAINKWQAGEAATTPLQHGVFSVCEKVAADLS